MKIPYDIRAKLFEFNIKRGEMPHIEIKQNKIQIKCSSSQQIISIDCDTLEQGIYSIENGNLKTKHQISKQSNPIGQVTHEKPQTQTINQKSQQKELDDKIELIFQKAIIDNLDDEDFEFAGLYGSDREQVIQYMREMFMKQVSMKILRTDYNNINRIFVDAIRMLEQEKNMSSTQENLSDGGKRR